MKPQMKESNFQDSMKKYLTTCFSERGVAITFDRTLKYPDTIDDPITRWASVIFGSVSFGQEFIPVVQIYCCTRNDPEGYSLVRLCDFVRSLFEDENMPDGIKRIPLYDKAFDSEASVQVGVLLPMEITGGDSYELSDLTKVRLLTVQLWYPSLGSI